MESNIIKQKFWALRQIGLATLCAGLIGGCYFLGRNYELLEKNSESKRFNVDGVIVTIVLMIVLSLIQDGFQVEYRLRNIIPSNVIGPIRGSEKPYCRHFYSFTFF